MYENGTEEGIHNKFNVNFRYFTSYFVHAIYFLYNDDNCIKRVLHFFFNILLVFHLFHFFTITIAINQPHIFAGGIGFAFKKKSQNISELTEHVM